MWCKIKLSCISWTLVCKNISDWSHFLFIFYLCLYMYTYAYIYLFFETVLWQIFKCGEGSFIFNTDKATRFKVDHVYIMIPSLKDENILLLNSYWNMHMHLSDNIWKFSSPLYFGGSFQFFENCGTTSYFPSIINYLIFGIKIWNSSLLWILFPISLLDQKNFFWHRNMYS